MSTLNELLFHRDVAGARYVSAVLELRAAFGDLAAIERVLDLPTFGGPQPDPIPLRHPKYLPNLGGAFEDDVRAALPARANAFGTPDE